MNKNIKFYIIIFIISFLSDNTLNFLAHNPKYALDSEIIKSLLPYFEYHNFIIAGILAGLTVIICYFITSLISNKLFNITIPTNNIELLIIIIIGFIVSYICDILIDYTFIFGKPLDPYYRTAGAGFWGGAAVVFAIICSYIVINIYNKLYGKIRFNIKKTRNN